MTRTKSRSQRHKEAGIACCSYAWAWGHSCCHLGLALYTVLWRLRTCLHPSLHSCPVLQGTASCLLLGHTLCLCSLLPPYASGSWLHSCFPVGLLLDPRLCKTVLATPPHGSLLLFALMFLLSIPHPHSKRFYVLLALRSPSAPVDFSNCKLGIIAGYNRAPQTDGVADRQNNYFLELWRLKCFRSGEAHSLLLKAWFIGERF